LAVADLEQVPNYFMMGGPYGPLGHGSFLPIIETLAGNIIQVIQKMQKDRIKSLTPKPEIAEQFREHAQLFLQRTAWTSVSNPSSYGRCRTVVENARSCVVGHIAKANLLVL
jgi:hypothetical protein